MRRILTLTLISCVAAMIAACSGSSTPPPETAAKAENTCAQPATPPKEGETPKCTDGCEWNGTECRAQRGVIIHDNNPHGDKDHDHDNGHGNDHGNDHDHDNGHGNDHDNGHGNDHGNDHH